MLPESWRERDNGEEVEYYFAVKKQSDVAGTRSDLDWVVQILLGPRIRRQILELNRGDTPIREAVQANVRHG